MFKYIVDLSKDFGDFQTDLSISDKISLDIETTGLNYLVDQLLLVQIKAGELIYIFDVRKLGIEKTKYILELINSHKVLIIGHNLKFDIKFLYEKTKVLLLNVYDTMLVEAFNYQGINSNKFFSLESLVLKYCSIQLNKEVRDSFINYSGEITQQQLVYSAEDVLYLEKIKDIQDIRTKEIKHERIINLEMKLLPVVTMIEYNGIKMDKEGWDNLKKKSELEAELLKSSLFNDFHNELLKSQEVIDILNDSNIDNPILKIFENLKIKVKRKRERISFLEKREYADFIAFFDQYFNTDSPAQIKAMLTGIYKIRDLKSTNAKDLNKIKNKYPIVNLISSYREAVKSITSFGDNYTDLINPITGRIHFTLHQHIADSGRFSCEKPNMQNIKREKEYRNAFIAEEGNSIISCDFSQQEFRLAGAITHEPKIIKAYQDNADMHIATASIVFGLEMSKVTKEQRDQAKGYNFGILYGASVFGLSYALGCSVDDAEKIINIFYKGYPVLARVKRALENQIINNLYSTTLLGRKRFFTKPPFFASTIDLKKWRRNLEKEGFNHIIQGTGADITKESLIEMFYNNPFGDKFKIILTVHDEIICEIKDEIIEKAKKYMIEIMERVEQKYLGEIPAKVEAKIAKYWEH